MLRDNLQRQRLEFKYLIREEVALAMRGFVRTYLVLDENSLGKPNNSYLNHSIYLDSPRLRCYWDVINGAKNRYKLRLRFYDDSPESPVFFEIKRRQDNAILKQRGAVRRQAVRSLLGGQLPVVQHLVTCSPKHLAALQRFHELMAHNQATPQTHVAYLREAWVSEHDNSVRVTFDRQVRSAPHAGWEISTSMGDSVLPWGELVILEIKFTGRFPNWFSEMVRNFEVMQCGVAKYAEGVALLDAQARLETVAARAVHSEETSRFLRTRTAAKAMLEAAPVSAEATQSSFPGLPNPGAARLPDGEGARASRPLWLFADGSR
jgi:hypothetical protein